MYFLFFRSSYIGLYCATNFSIPGRHYFAYLINVGSKVMYFRATSSALYVSERALFVFVPPGRFVG